MKRKNKLNQYKQDFNQYQEVAALAPYLIKQTIKKQKKSKHREDPQKQSAFLSKRISDKPALDQSLLLIQEPILAHSQHPPPQIKDQRWRENSEQDKNNLLYKADLHNQLLFVQRRSLEREVSTREQMPYQQHYMNTESEYFDSVNRSEKKARREEISTNSRMQQNLLEDSFMSQGAVEISHPNQLQTFDTIDREIQKQFKHFKSPTNKHRDFSMEQATLHQMAFHKPIDKKALLNYEQTLNNLRILYKINPNEYFERLHKELFSKKSPIKVNQNQRVKITSIEPVRPVNSRKGSGGEAFWNAGMKPPKPYPQSHYISKKIENIKPISEDHFFFPTSSPSNQRLNGFNLKSKQFKNQRALEDKNSHTLLPNIKDNSHSKQRPKASNENLLKAYPLGEGKEVLSQMKLKTKLALAHEKSYLSEENKRNNPHIELRQIPTVEINPMDDPPPEYPIFESSPNYAAAPQERKNSAASESFRPQAFLAASKKEKAQVSQTNKVSPMKQRTETAEEKKRALVDPHTGNFFSTVYNGKQIKERQQQLDQFLKAQQMQKGSDGKDRRGQLAKKDREILKMFLKRHGVEEDRIVFTMNSRDNFLARAAQRRNWFENPVPNSQFFDVKWDYNDSQQDHNALQPTQLYNHFPFGRELTTKQGLNKNLYAGFLGVDVDAFYPRCYDLSDMKQIESFQEDFRRTAVLAVVKKHAKLFKKIFREELDVIVKEDEKILDNVFKLDNKRNLKRKYHDVYPSLEILNQLGLINTLLLQNSIFFAKNLINDITESCEGDEFFKKNFLVPRFKISQRVMDLLLLYSNCSLPLFQLSPREEQLRQISGWETPSLYLMFVTLKIHRELKRVLGQYRQIERGENVWVCKPSYNARGFGIYCFNQMKDLMIGQVKKAPMPKIVQKYVERTLLLRNIQPNNPNELRKFDIRQWVFVSSFDPLKVYVYKKAYLRICGSEFDLQDISDPYKHISNYTIQKKLAQQDSSSNNSQSELVMHSDAFISYLQSQYPSRKDLTWSHFFDQICDITKATMSSISDSSSEKRPNCFELYGFDFVVDKDFGCWLLEVNMSPACAERTPWLRQMLDDMAEGMLSLIEKKVVQVAGFAEGNLKEVEGEARGNWHKIEVEGPTTEGEKRSISPVKGGRGMVLGYGNGNQKNLMLEVVGQKCSLKHERRLDKLVKQQMAAQFVQRVWRGYYARKYLKLDKINQLIRQNRKKQGVNLLYDILSSVQHRFSIKSLLHFCFQDIKHHQISLKFSSSPENLQKLTKLQLFIRSYLQSLPHSDYLNEPPTPPVHRSPYQIQIGQQMIEEEELESCDDEQIDQTRQSVVQSQNIKQQSLTSRSHNSRGGKNSTFYRNLPYKKKNTTDQEFLLDFSVLGIKEQHPVDVPDATKLAKSNTKGGGGFSASPYLASMKFKTQMNFRKARDRKAALSKSTDQNQQFNGPTSKNQMNYILRSSRDRYEGKPFY